MKSRKHAGRGWATLVALGLVLSAVGPVRPVQAGADPFPICGDVNGNLSVTSSDALLTLRKAVGQPVALQCTECPLLTGYRNTEFSIHVVEYQPGELRGNQLTFDQAVTVSRFGLDLPTGGSKVRMALYKDESGSPGALVVATAAVPVVKGQQEIAVPIKPIAAGTYWLVAVFDVVTNVGAGSGGASYARRLEGSFDDPLPDPFVEAVVSTNPLKLNYWVKVLP